MDVKGGQKGIDGGGVGGLGEFGKILVGASQVYSSYKSGTPAGCGGGPRTRGVQCSSRSP